MSLTVRCLGVSAQSDGFCYGAGAAVLQWLFLICY